MRTRHSEDVFCLSFKDTTDVGVVVGLVFSISFSFSHCNVSSKAKKNKKMVVV